MTKAMDLIHSTVAVWLLIMALMSSSKMQVKCQSENGATLDISTHDVVVIVSEQAHFTLQLNGKFDKTVNVKFNISHADSVDITPNEFSFTPESNITNISGVIYGRSPGHVEIVVSAIPPNIIDTKNVYVRVVVALSSELISFSSLIGWFYFVAWSISFYPQIYTNYKQKSVVGLNFDFLSLNIVGFLLYGIFNVGLYAIPEIQDEYSKRFPRGLNPVQLNDVFFAAHATFATLITITQCFIYDAYMNYQRKSTIGWSIGNVLLDFTGGMLGMLQMMLNAYNYDDWVSIFGDPTKFGLGLFSVMFDILFVLQHYVFYRETTDKKLALMEHSSIRALRSMSIFLYIEYLR